MRFIRIDEANTIVTVINSNKQILETDIQTELGNIGEVVTFDEEGNILSCSVDSEKADAEALKEQKVNLLNDIDLAYKLGDATELSVLQQDYTDLCGGVPIITKAELQTNLTDAELDAEKYLGIIMETEEVW
jgi:hypothetical protein